MIRFENISLSVQQQTLLEGANLQIAKGEKVVIRGPSGCGKSSLLKCAIGALPMREGSIRIGGTELSAATVSDIRGRLAFIGQEPILGAETVRDALLLPFQFKAHRGHAPSDATLVQSLEQFHLSTDILAKPSKRISGGEKQRIAILRALLLGKKIFMADEVTSALDPESKTAVMTELFRPGITLLSVSHDPDWIAACDRIVEIREEKLQEIGHRKTQKNTDPCSSVFIRGDKTSGAHYDR